MKAFLLAAGRGTRLRPLTDTVPKCLVPINGLPMLDIWLTALCAAGVDEVLVNVHHLADAVCRHIEARSGPPLVRTVYEAELLGSAGTLLANREWAEGEELILVAYADNLTDFDVRILVDAHKSSGEVATLGVFHADRPSNCGIVEVDGRGRMIGFEEKPEHPTGDLANAGLYAFDPRVFDEVDGPPPKDIGYDLLPRLVGRAMTVPIEGYFRDIGTLEAYGRAQDEWPVGTSSS